MLTPEERRLIRRLLTACDDAGEEDAFLFRSLLDYCLEDRDAAESRPEEPRCPFRPGDRVRFDEPTTSYIFDVDAVEGERVRLSLDGKPRADLVHASHLELVERRPMPDGPTDAEMLDWAEASGLHFHRHDLGWDIGTYGGKQIVEDMPTLRDAIRAAMAKEVED